jgi:ABC-2 type transport system permease protein
VALGALIRHSAGVISLVLFLPFVVEPLLGSTPKIGKHVGPLLPFANAAQFTKVPSFQTYPMRWGPNGSLLYFAALIAVAFVAAIVVTDRRDP